MSDVLRPSHMNSSFALYGFLEGFGMPISEARTIVLLGGFADSLIRFRGELLKRFVEAGHHVVACAPDASEEVRTILAAWGVRYRHVPIDRAGTNLLKDLRTIVSLVRLFRELKPDAVLSYTIKPVLYGGLAAMITGVPDRYAMITGVGHAFVAKGTKAWVISRIAGILYRTVLKGHRRVIFQNPDDRALFERLNLVASSEQTALINGSGVDVDLFSQQPLPQAPSFLLIGRLIRNKGVYDYVEAARIVKERYPDVEFKLAGWVDENPTSVTEEELDGWTREGVIDFLGSLDDVRPALEGSLVYVLPSYSGEGTPRAVLEAMATGRPIVTTDAPGCRETVIEGKNGYLVPPRNVQALTNAMMSFLETPDLAKTMGAESRRIAETRYNVHDVNEEILKIMNLETFRPASDQAA